MRPAFAASRWFWWWKEGDQKNGQMAKVTGDKIGSTNDLSLTPCGKEWLQKRHLSSLALGEVEIIIDNTLHRIYVLSISHFITYLILRVIDSMTIFHFTDEKCKAQRE